MAPTVLHFRAESKPLEYRSAVTPTIARKLVEAGYEVHVERSELSIFPDSEYAGTGAKLVPFASWTEAPKEHIVIGLKELPEEDFPLKHVHVQFAHCVHPLLSTGTGKRKMLTVPRLQRTKWMGEGARQVCKRQRHSTGSRIPGG